MFSSKVVNSLSLQAHDSEDGHSLCNAGDGVGTSSADTSDNEERARLGRRSSSQTERQGSAGPIRGHVEYLQVREPPDLVSPHTLQILGLCTKSQKEGVCWAMHKPR